jgi:predicted nucleic acid binding AN1-type Zn finger protein
VAIPPKFGTITAINHTASKEELIAKCPYCKQALTLEKTLRDSMDHPEVVHSEHFNAIEFRK